MANKKSKHRQAPEVSRRTFLKSIGVSSVSAAAARGGGVVNQMEHVGILEKDKIIGPGKVKVSLMVNGKTVSASIEPRTTLADALRDYLHLTGTKIGCDRGACGACTVIMDGRAVLACMTLALDTVGCSIETVEGLVSEQGKLHPLQEAFIEEDAMQCGFCTSGMIMSSKDLLDHHKQPAIDDIKAVVSGNLCRCGTYPHVFKAVEKAAKKMK